MFGYQKENGARQGTAASWKYTGESQATGPHRLKQSNARGPAVHNVHETVRDIPEAEGGANSQGARCITRHPSGEVPYEYIILITVNVEIFANYSGYGARSGKLSLAL